MNQILVIASSTLREHSRRKILAFFGIFSVILTGGLIWLVKTPALRDAFQTGGNEAARLGVGLRVVLTGSSVFSLFALIATLATSMGNVGRPFSNGEALTILARPLSRAQYVLGRFAAGGAVVVAFCVLLALQLQLVVAIAGGGRFASGILWGHWAATAFNLVMVSAIATFFSALVSTPALVAVIAYFMNQVIAVSGLLYRLAKEGVVDGTVAQFFRLLWFITPKYLVSRLAGVLQGGPGVAEGRQADIYGTNSVGLVLWAVAWLAALLALTILRAGRKDV